MAIEDTFNGAKNAYTFFGVYVNTVAQEIGMERALALHTKMCETAGSMQGKMMKEQAGIKEFDAKAAYSLAKAIPEGIGLALEVLEESPTRVRFKCGRCSIYDGHQAGGLDDKTRETMCRAGSLRFMDTMVKQLNPNLSYQLRKFRSAADDFCEEEIVLG
ncbi:unnamed protein product [marine sediment metagenome]|uniref:Uncharacterized protein n=1 Tax=marine sediment metagenome TaxID=412755 RepID=X1MM40_9ZZZZ